MEFLYGHEKEVGEFVSTFTRRGSAEYGRCKSIGILDDEGYLIAGVVYHNYDDKSEVIEFGLATITRRFLTRASLRRLFEYPFIECGCQMLVTRVRADNEPFLSILARLNFSFIMIPRLFGRDEDGVLATLTDDDWLESRISKRLYRDVMKREAA